MYLPQRTEVEAIVQQNKTLIIACLLLFLVAIAGGWLVYRHYDRQAASDNNANERLAKTKNSLQTANVSLTQASNELQRQKESLQTLTEQINKMTKKEARLKRQRDTWAVAAGVLLVGLAMK